MPKIVNHLNRLHDARYFDDQELALLQRVYDRGRFILEIEAKDPRLEKLALLIFKCSDQTRDEDALLANVIKRFDRSN